ncbi:DUF3575 domain-containing protein [Capnocytophaga sp. oral taxon 878]|uniref:DUF3575 domain-containing protein n=1 Tax=Capnocytophaga sp. oral taxon 878 TaxID=1316596 RepID=UPI000D024F59|nr:DUF3575 domain-containing protein [Capnocytophaga sp. oral taxon 878]AVM50579.1 DUF3575 domain-containing protein [Capnocytophaga sp. oral taxon 878]
MKRIILAAMLLFASVKTFAQDDFPKHQVNLNVLNVIWLASVELGYEHFFAFNQSIEGEIFINDRFSFFTKKNGEKYSANSVKLGYNYYFDLDGNSGPYVNPFIKQRFGKFKYADNTETSLDSFIVGIGAGYQWNYNDTFVIAPYANIARNFGKGVKDDSKFWAIEPNLGIKIAYKF